MTHGVLAPLYTKGQTHGLACCFPGGPSGIRTQNPGIMSLRPRIPGALLPAVIHFRLPKRRPSAPPLVQVRWDTVGRPFLVPAARRFNGPLAGIAVLDVDSAPLEFVPDGAGVGVRLAEGAGVASELVVHLLVSIVSDRDGNRLHAECLHLLGHDGAGVGHLLPLQLRRVLEVVPRIYRDEVTFLLWILPVLYGIPPKGV